MTAHASDEEQRIGLEAGMDHYMRKPIKLQRLKEMLQLAQNGLS